MWLIDEACLRRLVAYWAEFTGGEATAVRNILASRYYVPLSHTPPVVDYKAHACDGL